MFVSDSTDAKEEWAEEYDLIIGNKVTEYSFSTHTQSINKKIFVFWLWNENFLINATVWYSVCVPRTPERTWTWSVLFHSRKESHVVKIPE